MRKYLFGKKQRLLSFDAFKPVLDHGFAVKSKEFTVAAYQNNKTFPCLGIIVAKKQFNHATLRNRLKRVVRESFRLYQQNLTGFDVVVVLKKRVTALSKSEFRQKLDQTWQKLQKQ